MDSNAKWLLEWVKDRVDAFGDDLAERLEKEKAPRVVTHPKAQV